MAYSGGYNFVIDSSFTPMSLQEMLVPFTAYKDAFEKTEEAYVELSDKSNKFKYLSEQLPEGSKARQIYEGYADTLASQAEDLARNGLTAGNKRALTSLKRRYSGEIGRLEKADEALQKEREMRRARGLQDSSMLYAIDNMGIDDFLDGSTPNLYGISGNELYTRGATLGKAMSSRMTSSGDAGSVINGYYRDWVTKNGVSQESMAAFMQSAPVQQMVDNILMSRGVAGNLTGANLARARQEVLNGIYDGVVYQESHNPVRDPGVMGAAELDASRRGWAGLAQSESHFQQEMAYKRAALAASIDDATGKKLSGRRSGSGSSSDTEHRTQGKHGLRLSWHGNNPKDRNGDADNDVTVHRLPSDVEDYNGTPKDYDDLPGYMRDKVDKVIGNRGDPDDFEYYYTPYKGGFFNDQESELYMVPRDIITDDNYSVPISYNTLPTK